MPGSLPGDTSPAAAEILRGVIRMMADLGYATLTELTLANGRRADIAALGPAGEFTIVEVKSCLADFRADQKWRDYRAFCDQFFFAVDDAFPRACLPEDAGLIVADRFGGAILRDADVQRLAPARRKALTLRFARLSAQRLHGEVLTPVDALTRRA